MKIRHVSLENFKRHRKLEVDVRPGLIGLVGANGSGKSSFLSSMAFAITGSPLNDDTRDKMLTWGEKNGFVEMLFEHNGTEYTVNRQIGKMAATLDGGDLSVKGVSQVNAEMQRMAGTPFDLFKGVMFVAQAALDAPLRGTDAARKESFGKLFNCQKFDRLRDVLQEGITRMQGRCSSVTKESIGLLEQRKMEVGEKLASVEEDIARIKDAMKAFDLPSLYTIMNSVPKDDKAIADTNREIKYLDGLLETFEDCDLSKWDAARNASEASWYKSMVSFIDTGKCPMCGRPAEKPPLTREEAKAKLDALNAERTRMEDKQRAMRKRGDLVALAERLAAAKYTQADISAASNRIKRHTQLEMELREAMSIKGWCTGTLQDLDRQMAEAGEKLQETEQAHSAINMMEAVRNAFHRDCVQKAIRSCGAKQINDRLADYLAVFSLPYTPSFDDDGLLRFSDPSTGTVHEFSDLSGGQGNLVALAYRLALMQMFAGNVRVAILDEPTYGVDKQNLEAMCESFRALSEYAGERGLSIFVATHEETLFPSFNQVIEL